MAHEAGGHAYFDAKVPYIASILPPRYNVAMRMIMEISAFLPEVKEAGRHHDYTPKETMTTLPQYRGDGAEDDYYHELCKYFADTDPGLNEAGVYQAACNQFAMGFLSHQFYLNQAIDSLTPEYYGLMYHKEKYYATPVLDRENASYLANINLIMRTYLQAAMPDGVQLTLDVDAFMAEVSRNIDRVDKERAAQGLTTCAQSDAALAECISQMAELGDEEVRTYPVIGSERLAWLDRLLANSDAATSQNPQVLHALRANSLYSNF